MSSTIIAGATGAVLNELDREIAELVSKRDKAMKKLLDDLAWMDVPTVRIDRWNSEELGDAVSGTVAHVVRQYQEVGGGYDRRLVHRADKCGDVWYCQGAAGAVVKGGTTFRWRFLCEGEFEVVGWDGEGLVLKKLAGVGA